MRGGVNIFLRRLRRWGNWFGCARRACTRICPRQRYQKRSIRTRCALAFSVSGMSRAAFCGSSLLNWFVTDPGFVHASPPTETNAPRLSATSHVRLLVEQARLRLLKWIGIRRLVICQNKGLDPYRRWAIKEISVRMFFL